MVDYRYAIRLTTTRACLRKTNKRRGKKYPVCLRTKPVFLRTRLLTYASFRASLSYRITTAEKLRSYGTIYNRARLPPRETDHIWPKVREFSTVETRARACSWGQYLEGKGEYLWYHPSYLKTISGTSEKQACRNLQGRLLRSSARPFIGE